jgi:transposase-like protein
MRGLLSELDKSGLSVTAFSRERGIAVSRLWYWRKRFRDEAAAQASPRLVPVTIRSSSPPLALIVEVKGRLVRVPNDFDVEGLRRLVGALESC